MLRCTWTSWINLKIFLGYDINYLSIWPSMHHPWFAIKKASKLTFFCFQLVVDHTWDSYFPPQIAVWRHNQNNQSEAARSRTTLQYPSSSLLLVEWQIVNPNLYLKIKFTIAHWRDVIITSDSASIICTPKISKLEVNSLKLQLSVEHNAGAK